MPPDWAVLPSLKAEDCRVAGAPRNDMLKDSFVGPLRVLRCYGVAGGIRSPHVGMREALLQAGLTPTALSHLIVRVWRPSETLYPSPLPKNLSW